MLAEYCTWGIMVGEDDCPSKSDALGLVGADPALDLGPSARRHGKRAFGLQLLCERIAVTCFSFHL